MLLLEKFTKWKEKNGPTLNDEEDDFSIFFQEDAVGKSFMEHICDVSYQIYLLQVCVEGLLEDKE